MTHSTTLSLGDRMKEYERNYGITLARKRFTIIRIDGKAFHTFLRGADKPFDHGVMSIMGGTARALCEAVQGALFAYTQSDEISIVLEDFAQNAEPWFGGKVQKIASVSASIATAAFNSGFQIAGRGPALFDSRVFQVPNWEEALNYFIWRQQDCAKNAVSMVAQSQFSHKELQGKHSGNMIGMLADKGINYWGDYPLSARMGQWVIKNQYTDLVEYTHKVTGEVVPTTVVRNRWVVGPSEDFAHADNDGYQMLIDAAAKAVVGSES